ncbi:MAG TPA: alkaline phosphatase family protein [Armatimonadota bacterium]|jgi:predicted AlkP superfamily phosphohydrolase/phosphomutase
MKPVRVLFVGWDGAEPELVEPWLRAGKLPVLAQLLSRGAGGRIESTVPAVTPPAWTSAVTGVNPGRHGIYSFTRPHPLDYGEELVTAAERQAPSVWQYLSSAGRRVGVFNLSLSYPPEPLNGFLFAGFDAPVFAPQIMYPSEVFPRVTKGISGYIHEGLGDLEGEHVPEKLNRQARQQAEMLHALTEEIPVEILAVNYNAPDHVHHHAWPLGSSAEEIVAQGGSAVEAVYRHLDGVLGELLERYTDDDTNVIIFSDHGGGGMKGHLSLAQALEQGGFIVRQSRRRADLLTEMRRTARRMLPRQMKAKLWAMAGGEVRENMAHRLRAGLVADVDWSRTRAFPWGSSGFVQVNLQGRQPQGCVPSAEYDQVRAEVIQYLSEFRDPHTGQPIVGFLKRGEEAFGEPRVGYCPDVVAEGAGHEYAVMPQWEGWGADWKSGLRMIGPGETRLRGVTANHRPWGILYAGGPAVRAGASVPPLRMVDVAPTIMYLAGEPVPRGLDGRVARELWDTGVDPGDQEEMEATTPGAESAPYSEAEQAAVESRLRDLGYM